MRVLDQSAAQKSCPETPLIVPLGLALIFDMDGVVVDSMPIHRDAWRQYLRAQGITGEDLLARMHGRRNDEIVLDFLGSTADQKTVEEHGAAKERLYRQLMRDRLENQLVRGVRNFLQRLAPAPVGLASNAERLNIDFVLDGADLRPFFQVIVDGSQVERPKPAPDVYLRAAHQLGIAPANCIVFEDSPVGVRSARDAGARVVGLLTHENSLDHVELAVPDFLDPRLYEWLPAQSPEGNRRT